jgi:hypothetical protein
VNLDQQWTYLEPDAVCSGCGTLAVNVCDCRDAQVVCGGPGRFITLTERDILREYYEYWRGQMVRAGKLDLITPENCIEDWVVVNWARKGGPPQ